MTQLSGSWSAELDTTLLVEEIAQRTAIIVVGMLRAAPAGSEVYARPADPDPGAGGRQGARFGGVLDDGTVEPEDGTP